MKPRIGIIQFPGSNCEYETIEAVKFYGFDADILRWNAQLTDNSPYDAYILPGGFSYQDRIRAGAIASRLPLMKSIQKAALKGIPVLGICNGCQILSETGLVPDLEKRQTIEIALAPNQKDGQPIGFICDWKFIKITHPEKCVFTSAFSSDDILPIPINHGEGRFVVSETIEKAIDQVTHITYCDHLGHTSNTFPINPNGSAFGLAGISNTQGTILAIMPHPERASFIKQLPSWVKSPWTLEKSDQFMKDRDGEGPWAKLFISLRTHLMTTQVLA